MSTAVATNKTNDIEVVRTSLDGMADQFKAALPPQIAPEKFLRVVMTAIQLNADLLKADRKSLFASCVQAAQDGLLPDKREGALVIYGTQVQWMPMVGGIMKKVRNSGELASLACEVVFENDKFKYWVDDNGGHLEHEPLVFGDRGKDIGVYALVKTKDGAVYIEVMSRDQVMAVQAASRAKNGPWKGPFEHEMWRKTAIRRLSKRLPMSTDLEQVITRNDNMYDLDAANNAAPNKASRLESILTTGKAVPEPTNEETAPQEVASEQEPASEVLSQSELLCSVCSEKMSRTKNNNAWRCKNWNDGRKHDYLAD